MDYRRRHLEKRLQDLSTFFKVILILGARQVGKTTLLKHLLPDTRLIVFDPVQDLYGARRDPDLFLDNFGSPIILDEVQYVPELLPAIKRWVDKKETPAQYYLTGSQNLHVLKSVSESMAGRVGILHLEGMTPSEILGQESRSCWLPNYLEHPKSLKDLCQQTLSFPKGLFHFLWKGTMPGLLDAPDNIVTSYFQAYIQTYVERDVRMLENIRELSEFDRFLGLSAALTAQELNMSQLGREIGISPQTARRWLDLLANSYQWLELFPYHGNTIKRLTGKRKGYWRDTGVTCYLQRISSPESLAKSPLLGAIFESWAVNFIHRQFDLITTPPRAYHWRTQAGAEVDLVLERNGSLYPIEIKCKSHISKSDLAGLRAFRATYPNQKIELALMIYAGDLCYYVDEHTLAIPWNACLP